MPVKQISPPFKQINTTINASITGLVSDVEKRDRAFYDVIWTGVTPIGELFIERANTNDNDTVWKEVDFGAPITITGNSGSHQIAIDEINWKYIRARYAHTSGTLSTLVAELKSVTQGA